MRTTNLISLGFAALALPSQAIDLDINDDASIKSAASTVAYGMMKYYHGNETAQTIGELPWPYYWWHAGAMWGSMMDYWYYTGDTTYNNVTTEAMLFQAGDDDDYMPLNQTKSEGNDDQAFWGMAAMSAAEVNFPNPPAKKPQWLALAQAVFNTQALRWDTKSCGGGLRWQIFTFNNGYNYKNSVSNGGFFNLGARLAKYTGNTTYSDWASKTWDWMEESGLMTEDYYVYDGSDTTKNCSSVDKIQWTYNAGIFLLGAATMWNITGEQVWEDRTRGLWNATHVFFTDEKIMYEVACEPSGNCNVDQHFFKAYLARWIAASSKVAPFLAPLIKPYLQASALGAASSCSGGTDGVTCGTKWFNNVTASSPVGWDQTYGVGQQLCALEVIQSNLIENVKGPVTNGTGGTSTGDDAAGGSGSSDPNRLSKITAADRAGAVIITLIVLGGWIGGMVWLII
ncbi:mannan endo-1,6-alpha-mannosidase [Aureobasidium pullulans]|uniref:Mannan endo-1,6-alpha-mannosidase n=1 Tax=Aureobasidium pullulans TaxID=5580 RepID=A0A4T0BQM3_AURPU|nr:mannan endo-1,6-alpha-mannosidase [Aureobasidium pullulans]